MIEEIKAYFKPFKIKVNTKGTEYTEDTLSDLKSIIFETIVTEVCELETTNGEIVKVHIAKQTKKYYLYDYPPVLIFEGNFFLPMYGDVHDIMLEGLYDEGTLTLSDGTEFTDIDVLRTNLEPYKLYSGDADSGRNVISNAPSTLLSDSCEIFNQNFPTLLTNFTIEETDLGVLESLKQFNDLDKGDAYDEFYTVGLPDNPSVEGEFEVIKVDEINNVETPLTVKIIASHVYIVEEGIPKILTNKTVFVLEDEGSRYFTNLKLIKERIVDDQCYEGLTPMVRFINSTRFKKVDFKVNQKDLLNLNSKLKTMTKLKKEELSFDFSGLNLISSDHKTVD